VDSGGPKPDVRDVEAFLIAEARLLDEGRFEEWLALFSDDGYYWIPLVQGQASPEDMVSIIYDDRRALETRVRQLSNANRHAQSPRSITNHLVGSVSIERSDGSKGILVRSSQHTLEARGNKLRMFGGEVLHQLMPAHAGSFKILWKRVNLVNCSAAHDGFNVPI
jgi:3-phenylpropionate/cinnamic acid dioxygenase small subunit